MINGGDFRVIIDTYNVGVPEDCSFAAEYPART
jgi:hypothetical protein